MLDRTAESAALEDLLSGVRSGVSGVLVVRGEAGIGKTVLLESALQSASDMTIARIAGAESEMELAFAGLHQLLRPFLGGLQQLPAPQRDALSVALGLQEGSPDKFLIALATLTLITDAATERPILCAVDDAQWLDQASLDVAGFTARRLFVDRVGMLFTVRDGGVSTPVLSGLPQIRLQGLSEPAASELLTRAVGAPLSEPVTRRIITETGANPLALLELGGELTREDLTRAAALGEPLPVGARLEELFQARAQALPPDARLLLLVAAADPSGDARLLIDAARNLAIAPDTLTTPELDRFLVLAPGVSFRHPLMRSAIYHGAGSAQRRRVHQALAAVSDRETDLDRRAWHLAAAAPAPSEEVAIELERSAGRAEARGGSAAAAALLQRSVELTADPSRLVERALAAAQACLQSGGFATALALIAVAGASAPDEFQRARAELLRAQVAFASGLGSDAPPLLLRAAKRLEPLDLDLARTTYLDAWGAATFAGPVGARDRLRASGAVKALPIPVDPRPVDVLLEALASLIIDGREAAASGLREATRLFAGTEVPAEQRLRWGWLATAPGLATWDYEGARAVCTRQLQLVREAGALAQLPIYLIAVALTAAWSGDFAAAASAIMETEQVSTAIGAHVPPAADLLLRALRGQLSEAEALISDVTKRAGESGQGVSVTAAEWTAALLYNGLGRYEEALAAARQACWDPLDFYPSIWALPELVESAVRCGQMQLAAETVERLAATTAGSGTDLGLGLQARSRALVSEGAAAEDYHREAIKRLSATRERPELARAHLLYGEWLRRQNRRVDARSQLRSAFGLFEGIGMQGFAERARIELLATGERVRKRSFQTRDTLTAQEREVATLARDGLSNAEIGARLFVSANTVAYHLRKVFPKLGITSRAQLAEALAAYEERAQR